MTTFWTTSGVWNNPAIVPMKLQQPFYKWAARGMCSTSYVQVTALSAACLTSMASSPNKHLSQNQPAGQGLHFETPKPSWLLGAVGHTTANEFFGNCSRKATYCQLRAISSRMKSCYEYPTFWLRGFTGCLWKFMGCLRVDYGLPKTRFCYIYGIFTEFCR